MLSRSDPLSKLAAAEAPWDRIARPV